MRSIGIAPASALAGLPISIKDLLDVAGEPTLAGSVVLRESAPAVMDAPVVQRLRAAGAAILGKTNMTEFAFSGVGINPHYGTGRNPHDHVVARIPGGSSSGAALSVAQGMCAAAIGSDTGGSIRIPAALCGLVGFKSTARRVPTDGVVPLSFTLDTICAMTNSVDDCIAVDSVISGECLAIPQLPLAGLRLGVLTNLVHDGIDQHVASTFQHALTRLSAAGAQLVEFTLPELAELGNIGSFSAAEAYAWHRDLLAQHAQAYDPRVATRIALGSKLGAADYIKMHQRRRDWIARIEERIAQFDAVVLPTVPVIAPELERLIASDEAFFQANSLLLRNPAIFNILDGCAISLPCQAQGTLPVGLMLGTSAMRDAHLLGVARAVEAGLNQKRS